jgi:hypothetical protein
MTKIDVGQYIHAEQYGVAYINFAKAINASPEGCESLTDMHIAYTELKKIPAVAECLRFHGPRALLDVLRDFMQREGPASEKK